MKKSVFALAIVALLGIGIASSQQKAPAEKEYVIKLKSSDIQALSIALDNSSAEHRLIVYLQNVIGKQIQAQDSAKSK